jgi:hypothetical protein
MNNLLFIFLPPISCGEHHYSILSKWITKSSNASSFEMLFKSINMTPLIDWNPSE